jgi:PIN domain
MSNTRKNRQARQRRKSNNAPFEIKQNSKEYKIIVVDTTLIMTKKTPIQTQIPVLLKTLIVFDTNSLRSTEAGEVAYSFFTFGKPFQVIEEFIIENKLSDDIHIAIPNWTIEELKDQKQRQYKTDIEEFKKLAKRLSGLPHIDAEAITLPAATFDCAAFVGEKAAEYLGTKSIRLLDIREEHANIVLQSMMSRVMRDESKKAPFAHIGKYKDAGFKDNLVWESLMHYEGVGEFDKVIFLTKDNDYKNCDAEFKHKWNKHFSILKDENNVIVEIKKDYGNYIEERAIYDFARTEYFREYFNSELKDKTFIVIGETEYNIQSLTINPCKLVNRLTPNEDGIENIEILIDIAIGYTNKSDNEQQIVESITLLEDEESRDIISTEFNFELK